MKQLIFFSANWCSACQAMKPTVEQISKQMGIPLNKIDTDYDVSYTTDYGVRSVPTLILLENNQEILLPNTVNAVPALMLMNDNYKVLYGDNITNHLKPVEQIAVQKATNFNGEPSAFKFDGAGVVSDNFSFLDQNSDELSAKGSGGLRQLYSYATIDYTDKIETPPDDYVPDKVGEVNIKNLEQQRNSIN